MDRKRSRDATDERDDGHGNGVDVESRLKAYFGAVPEVGSDALEKTTAAVIRRAADNGGIKPASQKNRLLVPSLTGLCIAQLRATRGLVWVAQALVVLLALLSVASFAEQAFMLGAFGAASAILAGLTIASTLHDRNSPFFEMSYCFHFDYRRIVITRIMIYGFGDLVGLSVLAISGSSLHSLGLSATSPHIGEVVLCSGLSFFFTGAVCLFLLSRYRGEASLTLCFVFSALIATASSVFWVRFSDLLYGIPTPFWLIVLIVTLATLVLCTNSILKRIDAGYEFIRGEVDRT